MESAAGRLANLIACHGHSCPGEAIDYSTAQRIPRNCPQ